MKKTVDELTKECKALRDNYTEEMKSLEQQREEALRDEKYLADARQLKSCYDAHIAAGFTEEQAWEIITILLQK